MRVQPTSNPRLNEPIGFLLLAAAIAVTLSLVSYYPLDPSMSVAAGAEGARNLIGQPGAAFADIAWQWFGLASFLLPIALTAYGWIWIRSSELAWPLARIGGLALLAWTVVSSFGLFEDFRLFGGAIHAGGVVGSLMSAALVSVFNKAGTGLLLGCAGIVSVYLLTPFQLDIVPSWFNLSRVKLNMTNPLGSLKQRWADWQVSRREAAKQRAAAIMADEEVEVVEDYDGATPVAEYAGDADSEEYEERAEANAVASKAAEPPPIVPYTEEEGAEVEDDAPWERERDYEEAPRVDYRIPSTSLLAPASERSPYDPDELRALADLIRQKFAEFKVGGTVTQINPGPVVTTYEFKPDAGVKYSKIINLSEDLCLALQCESILVERIPGKSTVGIEAPNRTREIIGMREVVESREFREAKSPLTVALGKDISGRLKVADLASMPHLLVAGSTGSGKSVMINTFVMSILLRATPDEVRFIMVDPKTVELGLYSDIPHLLTPVITDMKKASNALKNATREMERRLKLLAEHAVRNIDQFNKKVERMRDRIDEDGNPELAAELKRLPYIVIIIDELADLMILEGRQIEESITRLAQMARAVGIHLVLATQRPSVDVITGLIKANIPARISFRLATRIDSRTILDSMGAEALLGRGDMLFLPPGTARMMRVHGPLISEDEIGLVVREWKAQGQPRYENEYLATPADEMEDNGEDEPGLDDPMYEEAVRLVLDMGKASTSTLQRRLRLGYGRAARILDAMERDGIIGPVDGSRPREVLKSPDWLAEVASTQ